MTKKQDIYKFSSPWKEVMGHPEKNGIWLVYGLEKNGKTWFLLKLSEYLSSFGKTLYMSAEEGFSVNLQRTIDRARLDVNNRNLHVIEFEALEQLYDRLNKQRAPKTVVLDNLTVYADELKYGKLRKLTDDFPNTLFILVAHEENNEPYTATAKVGKKLAKIIVRIKGLACFVSGRCPGGVLSINEEKAELYHGMEVTND